VERVGGHPGVEGDPELGPEAPDGDGLLLGSFKVYAVNQALKVEESKLRVDRAARSAREARLRSVAERASSMRDSVPHLAAA
jgi:hypothetical protein